MGYPYGIRRTIRAARAGQRQPVQPAGVGDDKRSNLADSAGGQHAADHQRPSGQARAPRQPLPDRLDASGSKSIRYAVDSQDEWTAVLPLDASATAIRKTSASEQGTKGRPAPHRRQGGRHLRQHSLRHSQHNNRQGRPGRCTRKRRLILCLRAHRVVVAYYWLIWQAEIRRHHGRSFSQYPGVLSQFVALA